MDQNDIYPEQGQPGFRRIYKMEEGQYPTASILYASVACMHCENAPCVMGCPTGAITKNIATGAVSVNQNLCIGCHSCALACPFGVPRFDDNNKMRKCNLCSERVEAGLKPACARVCPTGAIKFESINRSLKEKEAKIVNTLVNTLHRTTHPRQPNDF
jgi:Fe-S-cluster-containing dehydrogenase component